MKSVHYLPCPLLRPFVTSFWTMESNDGQTGRFRFAPDGHPELYFDLAGQSSFLFKTRRHSPTMPPFGVVGQFFPNSDFDISLLKFSLFVKLKPEGLWPIFQHDVSGFNNCVSPLLLLNDVYQTLASRYREGATVPELIQIIEQWLLDRLNTATPSKLVPHLRRQLQLHTGQSVQEVLSPFGLSLRRLQQLFKTQVGLSPKQYQRLARFRKAMNRMQQYPVAENAIDGLGYYDWSHFSKDMQYYFEMSPTDYVRHLSLTGPLINVRVS